MGSNGSIEVFQESDEVAAYDNKILGAKSESMISFGKRMYRRSIDILTSPDRHEYTASSLIPSSEYVNDFSVNEYDIKSPIDDDIIHLALWKRSNSSSSSCSGGSSSAGSMRCILYLHNNTRSIVDALEVLPLAKALDFDLISFDIPGCGKSTGVLSAEINIVIDKVISWYIDYYNSNDINDSSTIPNDSPNLLIWARGMSTKYAIEYCHREVSSLSSSSS